MGAVLPLADLVITATGTVAIECILSDTPILTLIKTLNNDMKNCPWLNSFEELAKWVEQIRNDNFPKTTLSEKIAFVNRLNRTSFRGIPYETALREDNISDCLKGFDYILNEISQNTRNI